MSLFSCSPNDNLVGSEKVLFTHVYVLVHGLTISLFGLILEQQCSLVAIIVPTISLSYNYW